MMGPQQVSDQAQHHDLARGSEGSSRPRGLDLVVGVKPRLIVGENVSLHGGRCASGRALLHHHRMGRSVRQLPTPGRLDD